MQKKFGIMFINWYDKYLHLFASSALFHILFANFTCALLRVRLCACNNVLFWFSVVMIGTSCVLATNSSLATNSFTLSGRES